MKNVLLVTSSPRGEASYSTQAATELAQEIGGRLTKRELWRTPPAAIGPEFIHATFTPSSDRTPEQRAALALSDELITELREADVIVVGAGMINFGMPASLKSWIDHVARKDETFRYGEARPEGLLTGKRLVLVLAYGGVYSSGPYITSDHLEPALRTPLGFLGLTDVEVVKIEGASMGVETVERAMAEASARAREVASLVAREVALVG